MIILNKQKVAGKVGVEAIDGSAKSGEDFEPFKKIINFLEGETETTISIKIIDDFAPEEDEDFFV